MNEQKDIDTLLERYLSLLDEYVALQAKLAHLHGAIYHHLARANFSAPRGVRYGADYYDGRMQAVRRVNITIQEKSGESVFEIIDRDAATTTTTAESESGSSSSSPSSPSSASKEKSGSGSDSDSDSDYRAEEEVEVEKGEQNRSGSGSGSDEKKKAESESESSSESQSQSQSQSQSGSQSGGEDEPKQQTRKSKDPLRWFGILTPMPLRQAQKLAVESVEDVIPRLATVNAEMAAVELEVRRARKKRAKAEKVRQQQAAISGNHDQIAV
ncbi:hypothetical protein QBC47DRAFT_364171 [Echria macrotheca]|uniref:Vacuolar ATPase assembly protein VMA22 n=1 Tax=Echria macrotheca TaxID=438768 RepID=A0AAJ0B7I3_9PEZI|nr:hypothetical protein QBC47DRAFT_364171 [Echria macrotheca]